MADTRQIREDIVHLARIALTGEHSDVQLLVRKLARRYKATDDELSALLTGLLRQSPLRGSPVRRAEPASLPFENESRLPLIRLLEVPQLDTEPVYARRHMGRTAPARR